MSKKSKPSLGEELIGSLKSISEALKAGEPLDRRFTVRTVKLDVQAREYGPGDVKAVRAKLGASQAVLGQFLGVTAHAVRKWEQGERAVPMMAARFLDEVQADPSIWARRVQPVEK